MLLSALGFALMAAAVKWVHARGIPVLEIVAARALVSLLLSYLDIRRKRIGLWGQRRDLLIARGAVGSLALLCVYYAVTALPLAEATLLQYLHPLFTAVLAWLFLKERLHGATLICMALGVAGLLLIARPALLFAEVQQPLPLLAVSAAVVGALGSAIAYVIVRKLSQSEDPSVIIFYFPLIALPFSLVLLGNDAVWPSGWDWLALLLIGVFTQVGQMGLTKALQTETAARATAFAYIQVVFSIVLGWLLFAELPGLYTWLGGSLIILGALVNLLGRAGRQ
ncbi:MAG: EamA family transporter [Gammaproteobacteria bacterium]|nr:MAG: EamA family transporter [Gammaproteobacteria bacterium]